MQQEVVLAMLAKEPSHGYELRTRLAQALGPVAEGISEAQMYVTLARLEKGGFVSRLDAPAQRSDRKVYCLTPAGQERVTEWMSDVSWPRPDLTEFHMKLVAAAQGGQGQWAWPNLAAVYVIVVTPGIIAFTLAQRLFFKGLMEGALKG